VGGWGPAPSGLLPIAPLHLLRLFSASWRGRCTCCVTSSPPSPRHRRAAQGLDYLHGKKLVHFDLKVGP
jgi:hypothetical protein